jgi:hypothetical protein
LEDRFHELEVEIIKVEIGYLKIDQEKMAQFSQDKM